MVLETCGEDEEEGEEDVVCKSRKKRKMNTGAPGLSFEDGQLDRVGGAVKKFYDDVSPTLTTPDSHRLLGSAVTTLYDLVGQLKNSPEKVVDLLPAVEVFVTAATAAVVNRHTQSLSGGDNSKKTNAVLGVVVNDVVSGITPELEQLKKFAEQSFKISTAIEMLLAKSMEKMTNAMGS